MSHLTYYNYDGVGKRNQVNFKYSQAVRVGDRIECSGQGRSPLDPPRSWARAWRYRAGERKEPLPP